MFVSLVPLSSTIHHENVIVPCCIYCLWLVRQVADSELASYINEQNNREQWTYYIAGLVCFIVWNIALLCLRIDGVIAIKNITVSVFNNL